MGSPRRIASSLYALRATDELIPWFALYAFYMIDSGLTTTELASLFVIWSVTAFALEVPSGAWADAFSRRRLIVAGAAIRGMGFLVWTVWPTYWGFALGFVLWGIRSAMKSGAVEALVFDELAAIDHTDSYLRIMARGQAVALVAMMLAVGLGAPIYALGGYSLAGWLSVAVAVAGVAAALSFPEAPRAMATDGGNLAQYLHQLRAGLAEARRNVPVRHALVLFMAMSGFSAFDEFVPLLLRDLGAATWLAALLLLIPAVAMALTALLVTGWQNLSPGVAAGLMAVAAVLVAAAPLSGNPIAAMVLLAGAFAVMQLMRLLTESRLQGVITGTARATVLSVGGLGAEVLAVSVYFGFGLAALAWSTSTVMALFALPIGIVAVATARWLPAVSKPGRPRAQVPAA